MRPFGLTANRSSWEMMGPGLISEAQATNIGALAVKTGDLSMKIRDSVAVVTGANRGIGLAFAQELLAAGRKVYAAVSWVAVPSGGTYSASTAAAWSLTNWLRTALPKQGTQVVGVHHGPVDTNMASDLTLPKVTPMDVVRQALNAVETGHDEVLVDDMTRQVKAGLSDREGIYLKFDPERAVVVAR
jgi:NAD(P)-dependent dehydrogenase (short-subunit alcohol dehydrogenase family)